ncbi:MULTISPECIES: SoxR reducing system RseC family protein [unclassified Marinitoga]|uniref:SoxR reducing system RseC family protein n=1 Tax=unclassified Marinitoga TaxID=2640159 RepID=UPI00064109E9|nr:MULTISPECIES: SoxR reducing system RseC family protein [unclassified Marinitoga]KLO22954.1 hypothetical protein X274_07625 [Marinitoga sp. 1155]NUV00360.1 hypothetical protein [Marinitoga sp. 1154]
MREIFIVNSIEGEKVKLISTRSSSCESCSLNGACNLTGSNSERLMTIEKKEFRKIPDIGDYVVIEIPDFSISKISFIIYGFPLTLFIALLVITYTLTKNDTQAFVAGIVGLAIAYGIIAYVDRTVFKKKYKPAVVEVLPKSKNFDLKLGIINN